jgi:endonuclease III
MFSRKKILVTSKILKKHYKISNLGNKKNPLNELLYIIISLRTTEPSTQRTYLKFKKAFPEWRNVYEAPVYKITAVLKNAGLSRQKACNLKLILKKIRQDWKILSLKGLKPLDNGSLEKYLFSLPGIGIKSARCIMMYSFNRKVFPVDSHCFRIIKRLGWIEQDSKYTMRIQNKIQELIPPKIRFRLHVNLIQHGRKICFPFRPRCKVCFLRMFCKYYRLHKI